ncbi:MAG: T9SS type A sorting domain-containing protein [Bacteroidetes bacterium]|nr:T9SS type A sorting domain-containing protein [Bacteroidota bacterium]
MIKMIFALFLLSLPFTGMSQAIYNGNGNTGAGGGGTLGTGSLSIADDGTTVTISFTRGPVAFYDAVVIYIDSDNSGDFANTSSFTDETSGVRRAASGLLTPNQALVNFSPGFLADYAVSFSAVEGLGQVYQLIAGPSSHVLAVGANLSTTDPFEPVFTVYFPWTAIGLTGAEGENFRFVVTLIDPLTGYRYDEAIGDGISSGNPEIPSSVTYTGGRSYYQGGYDTPLPVELLSWSATPADNKVILNWETASELNHAGFEILRSTTKDGKFQSILNYKDNDAYGYKGQQGGKYSFVDDRKVYNGLTYFYKLVDIAVDGKRTEHTTISAIPTDGKPVQPGFESPAEFAIKGLYPNPFNPSGNLEFSLPKKGFVSVELYNVIGQKVAIAFQGTLEGGKNHTNRIEISGNGLPSGVYLAVVNYSGQRLTSKFTLLK